MFSCLPFASEKMLLGDFGGNNELLTEQLLKEQTIGEILKCNEETAQYQLTLSKEEAVLLVDTRQEALRANHRIEIGGGVINKMIRTFKKSPYISQYNYASIMSELIDTFYYFKNETLDEVSDDELIDVMEELFDGRCQGSIELLQGRELERVAHNIRFGSWDFGDTNEESEEEE